MRRPAAVPVVGLLAVALLVASCGDGDSTSTTRASTTPPVAPATTVSVTPTVPPTTLVPMVSPAFPDRPYDVFVPSGYDDSTPTPLVISLHGFTASGALQDNYFKLQPEAEARGFLYIHPDGQTSAEGYEFWNATEACCAGNESVDDSGYLTSIIDEVSAAYNVDPSRIYLVGYSNGGFMSYRMACEHADRIAAIVSLGGATLLDPTECTPSEPVSVLEIHGDRDEIIEYDGGRTLFGTYPGAATTFRIWALYNGCGITLHEFADIDIESELPGKETHRVEYLDCPVDGHDELWFIEGGSHSPSLAPTFAATIIDWLYAHPKAK